MSDDIAGVDQDQAAYADAANTRDTRPDGYCSCEGDPHLAPTCGIATHRQRGADTRPDADESVAAIRALCDLCETHDLPVPIAITPARRGWDVTRVQVEQEDWAAWQTVFAGPRVYIDLAEDDGTEHHIGNGDHAGHRYQLVSVVG